MPKDAASELDSVAWLLGHRVTSASRTASLHSPPGSVFVAVNRHCGPAISSLRGEHVMIGASTFQTCDSCRCISPEVSKDLRILPQRQLHLAALRVACQSWGVSELTLTQSSEQSLAIV